MTFYGGGHDEGIFLTCCYGIDNDAEGPAIAATENNLSDASDTSQEEEEEEETRVSQALLATGDNAISASAVIGTNGVGTAILEGMDTKYSKTWLNQKCIN